jgi:hypothetical protein
MPFITSLKSSFLYSTVHLLYSRWWWGWSGGGGGGGGGLVVFFRIHVKGSLDFFVMQGVGQDILFSC